MAVITGRVVDEFGEPNAGGVCECSALHVRAGATPAHSGRRRKLERRCGGVTCRRAPPSDCRAGVSGVPGSLGRCWPVRGRGVTALAGGDCVASRTQFGKFVPPLFIGRSQAVLAYLRRHPDLRLTNRLTGVGLGRCADMSLKFKPFLVLVTNESSETVVSFSKVWTVSCPFERMYTAASLWQR